MNWDLAIIGGGPAGAMAAWRGAGLGLRVVVLDRGHFPRDRVCGEFVSAEALPLLQQAAPELAGRAPRLARAEWISQGGRRSGFALPQPGLGIARRDLDLALFAAASRAGAEMQTGVTVAAWRPERRELEYRRPGEHCTLRLRAQAVVLAAGRWWRIEGLGGSLGGGMSGGLGDRGAARPAAAWVGIKAHLDGLACDGLEMYAFPGGYCGLAATASGVNACALARGGGALRAGCRDLVPWLRSRARPLAERLAGAGLAWPVQVTAPVYLGGEVRRLPGVFCAGDAAGFADPFTGSGLARALLGGALAAEMAARALDGAGDLAEAAAAHAAALAAATRRARQTSHWLRCLLTAPEPWQGWAGRMLAQGAVGRRLAAQTRWDATAVAGMDRELAGCRN